MRAESPMALLPRQDIEALRILSAGFIVFYHVTLTLHELTYSGLVIFAILSGWLGTGKPMNSWALFRSKAERFLSPWAIWMVLYGVFNGALRQPVFGHNHHWWSMLLGGTGLHLWYMPFMFLCVLGVGLLMRRFPKNVLALAAWGAALAMLLSHSTWRPLLAQADTPWGQWAHAAPAFLIGVALSAKASARASNLWRWWVILTCAASACTALDDAGVGWPYLIALGLCALPALLPNLTQKLLGRMDCSALSRQTLGVYLAHIMTLECLRRVLPFGLWFEGLLTLSLTFAGVAMLRARWPSLSRYWS
jgi:surface polysaccharide O-acyltransferase-like enzyme